MHPVSKTCSFISSSIQNEYPFIGAVGAGLVFGGWIGFFGAGATYILGKRVCHGCQFPRAIQNIQRKIFGHCIKDGGAKATLLKAVLETVPTQNFDKWNQFKLDRDFLRRIKPKEWASILDQIKGLDRTSLSMKVLDAFELGKWDHPIFKRPNWLLLAFYAYLEGLLEEKYLPKLILFDACCKETTPNYGVRTFQLIDQKGNIDPDAIAICKREMKGLFNNKCIQSVIETLCNLPPEMSQFFQIQQPIDSRSLLKKLSLLPFFPFLAEDASSNAFVLTVFPPEFVYEILKVRFGENAVRPNPVIGYFKKEMMSSAGKRVISLAFSDYVKLPEALHKFPVTPLVVYAHDANYHLFIDSANIHKPAWNEIGKEFAKKSETDIVRFIFDGDFPSYRHQIKQNPGPLVFFEETLTEHDELFWSSLIVAVLSQSKDLARDVGVFCCYLKEHSEEWNIKYGLSFDKLKNFLIKMKSRIPPPDPYQPHPKIEFHVIRMLAKEMGLSKEFKLWPRFPKLEF